MDVTRVLLLPLIFACLLEQFYVQCSESIEENSIPRIRLESFCGRGDSEHFTYLQKWGTVILEAGFVADPKYRHHVSNCQITIRTDEGFGLVASIEHMKIRAQKDLSSRKRICQDYIQFSIPPKSFLGKIFSNYDLPFYRVKESEQLCGETSLKSSNIDGSKIMDISTDANSFKSPYEKMNFVFHQVYNPTGAINNSLVILITSYKIAKDNVFQRGCENKFVCKKKPTICIDPKLVCDGHVNCAFPGSAADESKCSVEEESGISKTILFSTLGVVTGIVVMLVLYFVCCKRSEEEDSDFDIATLSTQRIPGMSRTTQANLIAHLTGEQPKYSEPESQKEDLPPSYDTLFPVENANSSNGDLT